MNLVFQNSYYLISDLEPGLSSKELIKLSQNGRVWVLAKFKERSKLLMGIENYRMGILQPDPSTFFIPTHWDADTLFFVARGKGTINLASEERRESFNLRHGYVFKVPAGTTTYLINMHNNERLILTKLILPVSTPLPRFRQTPMRERPNTRRQGDVVLLCGANGFRESIQVRKGLFGVLCVFRCVLLLGLGWPEPGGIGVPGAVRGRENYPVTTGIRAWLGNQAIERLAVHGFLQWNGKNRMT
ncbi:hypothetical protein LguiB_000269 [Lonicera macranthoides]